MATGEAAYWWWETDGGTRAIVLTDAELVISGELDREQLADLEAARRRGRPFEADLGRHGLIVDLDQVVELRLCSDDAALDLLLVDGITSIGVRAPDRAIAAGLFEEIRRSRAPTSTVRSTVVEPGPLIEPGWWSQTATITFMAATGGLGALLCVFAAMEAGTAAIGGPSGVRSLIGSVFGAVGFLPALACFVLTLVLAVGRLVAERGEIRRRSGIRHEIRVVVPERPPATIPAPEPPPDAIVFAAPAEGIDPLADIMGDTT